ncbi:hypothetical protein EDC04DRAFT_2764036 [Pisolithus marmoratus]|nr:hypothetical protein EDC04DRAFT_2764036 [Pisolithus marmoratus]
MFHFVFILLGHLPPFYSLCIFVPPSGILYNIWCVVPHALVISAEAAVSTTQVQITKIEIIWRPPIVYGIVYVHYYCEE